MSSKNLDSQIDSLITAAGFSRARITPRGLARWFSIPVGDASRALRRASRRGLLVRGRIIIS